MTEHEFHEHLRRILKPAHERPTTPEATYGGTSSGHVAGDQASEDGEPRRRSVQVAVWGIVDAAGVEGISAVDAGERYLEETAEGSGRRRLTAINSVNPALTNLEHAGWVIRRGPRVDNRWRYVSHRHAFDVPVQNYKKPHVRRRNQLQQLILRLDDVLPGEALPDELRDDWERALREARRATA